MKKIFPIFLFFVSLLVLPLRAQPPGNSNNTLQEQTITLKDGTVLKGFLVDVRDSFYTIETKHMGRVNFHINDLKSLTATPSFPMVTDQSPGLNNIMSALLGGGQTTPSLQNQLPQLQAQLLADPAFMAMVQELMQDDSFTQMLHQENLMGALMSMDPDQIQNNPVMQQLLQNPKMLKIINYITEKMVTPR